MFIKVGSRLLNLDHVHSVDLEAPGGGVAIVVDHHAYPGLETPRVLHLRGDAAAAFRALWSPLPFDGAGEESPFQRDDRVPYLDASAAR